MPVAQIGVQGIGPRCKFFSGDQGCVKLPAAFGQTVTVIPGGHDDGWFDSETYSGELGKGVFDFKSHVPKAVSPANQLIVLFDPFVDVVRNRQRNSQIAVQSGGHLQFGIGSAAFGGDTERSFFVMGVRAVQFNLNFADVNCAGIISGKGRSGQGDIRGQQGKGKGNNCGTQRSNK